jgi:hypothetical protein
MNIEDGMSGLRGIRDARVFGPDGVAECSHGWRENAAGGRAEPVDRKRSLIIFLAPAGRRSSHRHARPRMHSSAPFGADQLVRDPIHGFRSPSANSTRGYIPAPLSGRLQ